MGWVKISSTRWLTPAGIFPVVKVRNSSVLSPLSDGGCHTAEIKNHSLLSTVTAANAIADVIGFNVLPMPAAATVEELISGLPIDNTEEAAKKITALADRIKTTVGAVSPSSS